jgi:hypothetical protein
MLNLTLTFSSFFLASSLLYLLILLFMIHLSFTFSSFLSCFISPLPSQPSFQTSSHLYPLILLSVPYLSLPPHHPFQASSLLYLLNRPFKLHLSFNLLNLPFMLRLPPHPPFNSLSLIYLHITSFSCFISPVYLPFMVNLYFPSHHSFLSAFFLCLIYPINILFLSFLLHLTVNAKKRIHTVKRPKH